MYERVMSRPGWHYGDYWYEGCDFHLENDQNCGEFAISKDGRLTIDLTGCRECGHWDSWDDLTIDQAIELGAYLNCVVIPALMEKENANHQEE